MEKRLQDKIMNVLTLAYPPGQIRVSATVVIDYDKMITEDLQYEHRTTVRAWWITISPASR